MRTEITLEDKINKLERDIELSEFRDTIILERLDELLGYNNFDNTFILFAKRLSTYWENSHGVTSKETKYREEAHEILRNSFSKIYARLGSPLSYKNIIVKENSYHLIELSGYLECTKGTCEIETQYTEIDGNISVKLLIKNYTFYNELK